MVIPVALSPACNTQLTIALSFGGPAWPISLSDLNLGTVSSGRCLGGIFDITAGSNVKPSPGTPQWIVGDTFLVRIFCYSDLSGILTGCFFFNLIQKNVYTVFRSNPPAVGFAQLSNAAGGSSGSQRFFPYHLYLGCHTCHGLLIRPIPSCGWPFVTVNASYVVHVRSSFRDLGSPSTTVGPAKSTDGSSCECSLLFCTLS